MVRVTDISQLLADDEIVWCRKLRRSRFVTKPKYVPVGRRLGVVLDVDRKQVLVFVHALDDEEPTGLPEPDDDDYDEDEDNEIYDGIFRRALLVPIHLIWLKTGRICGLDFYCRVPENVKWAKLKLVKFARKPQRDQIDAIAEFRRRNQIDD
jgi:hypothetical protein